MSGPQARVEPGYTVHWCKKWTAPLCQPENCRHGGSETLTINQRLEPKRRGGFIIVMDGSICMNCGSDTTGQLSLAGGLKRCMDEHGWHRDTGVRLYDLAEFHEDRLSDAPADGEVWPIWFLYAWGWTSKEIVDSLNAGSLSEAEQVPA